MTQGTILDFFLSRAVIYILTSSSNLIFRSLRSIRLDPLITLASITTISHIWSLTRFIGAFFESSSRNFCDISSHDEICLYYEKTAFISISRNNNLGQSVFSGGIMITTGYHFIHAVWYISLLQPCNCGKRYFPCFFARFSWLLTAQQQKLSRNFEFEEIGKISFLLLVPVENLKNRMFW